MTDNNNAVAVAANGLSKALTLKANIFLFDLKNESNENGFRASDQWILQLANEREMLAFKKEHLPLLSVKLDLFDLLPLFRKIKAELSQSLSKIELEFTESDMKRNEKQYLVAYHIKTLRK